MGRVAQFSAQEIIEAGKTIEKSGETVTAFSIREALGGGSHERLKKVWHKFNQDRVQHTETADFDAQDELSSESREELSCILDSVTSAFSSLLVKTSQSVKLNSDNSYKETLQAQSDKIVDLKEVERQAISALDNSDETIATLQRTIEDMAGQNHSLNEQCNRQAGYIESLRDHIAQLENQNKNHASSGIETGERRGGPQILSMNGEPLDYACSDRKY